MLYVYENRKVSLIYVAEIVPDIMWQNLQYTQSKTLNNIMYTYRKVGCYRKTTRKKKYQIIHREGSDEIYTNLLIFLKNFLF